VIIHARLIPLGFLTDERGIATGDRSLISKGGNMTTQTHRSRSMGRVFIGLAVLWGMIGLAGARSWATDSERTRATLRGVAGIQVVIADVGPDVERAGLTRQQLHTAVEAQLRQAGIPLVTSAERVHVPGQPFLAVAMHVVPRADGILAAYAITVEVYQITSLETAAVKAAVSTWSVGATGSIGLPLLATLRDSVTDAVKHFIDAYLSVNPRPVDNTAPAATAFHRDRIR
jgi:hypothetical protein